MLTGDAGALALLPSNDDVGLAALDRRLGDGDGKKECVAAGATGSERRGTAARGEDSGEVGTAVRERDSGATARPSSSGGGAANDETAGDAPSTSSRNHKAAASSLSPTIVLSSLHSNAMREIGSAPISDPASLATATRSLSPRACAALVAMSSHAHNENALPASIRRAATRARTAAPPSAKRAKRTSHNREITEAHNVE
jgi:hypothetical protein